MCDTGYGLRLVSFRAPVHADQPEHLAPAEVEADVAQGPERVAPQGERAVGVVLEGAVAVAFDLGQRLGVQAVGIEVALVV